MFHTGSCESGISLPQEGEDQNWYLSITSFIKKKKLIDSNLYFF
jgi:hypothetical protein